MSGHPEPKDAHDCTLEPTRKQVRLSDLHALGSENSVRGGEVEVDVGGGEDGQPLGGRQGRLHACAELYRERDVFAVCELFGRQGREVGLGVGDGGVEAFDIKGLVDFGG